MGFTTLILEISVATNQSLADRTNIHVHIALWLATYWKCQVPLPTQGFPMYAINIYQPLGWLFRANKIQVMITCKNVSSGAKICWNWICSRRTTHTHMFPIVSQNGRYIYIYIWPHFKLDIVYFRWYYVYTYIYIYIFYIKCHHQENASLLTHYIHVVFIWNKKIFNAYCGNSLKHTFLK